MKLSLCITNYNRYELLLESFEQVINDKRIDEIVISDDTSDMSIYKKLETTVKKYPKIHLYRNDVNVGMSMNKKLAIEKAKNDWCILFDSDNIITSEYLSALDSFNFNENTIAAPCFAKPDFDYRRFSYWLISKTNVKNFLSLDRMAECFLNTCNYVVNKKRYLEIYKYNPDMKGTDTIWFNYLWLKSGGFLMILRGMEYFHRNHEGSGFKKDLQYNMMQAGLVKEMITTI